MFGAFRFNVLITTRISMSLLFGLLVLIVPSRAFLHKELVILGNDTLFTTVLGCRPVEASVKIKPRIVVVSIDSLVSVYDKLSGRSYGGLTVGFMSNGSKLYAYRYKYYPETGDWWFWMIPIPRNRAIPHSGVNTVISTVDICNGSRLYAIEDLKP